MNKLSTFLDKFQPDLANDLVWEKVPPMSVLSSDMQPEKNSFTLIMGTLSWNVLSAIIGWGWEWWERYEVLRRLKRAL